jgi:hypothetical protein
MGLFSRKAIRSIFVKTSLTTLLILPVLLGLTACGSKSPGGTLEVSQSFAITNTSYGGGLIISGEHLATGKTFSHSIQDSKEMRIQLDQGVWKISAVGWDGGNANLPQLFAGDPYCGSVNANLATASTVIDLTISKDNCNSSEFTGDLSGNLQELKAIVSCNSFFVPGITPQDLILTSIINNPGSEYFCDSAEVDLRSEVKSIKIYAVEKLPDQSASAGFSSECIANTTQTVALPSTSGIFKLPVSNLPLKITTFKDNLCQKPLAFYQFEKGLKATYSDFDHLLFNTTSNPSRMNLLLPGNQTRRGYSPFMALMPAILNNSGVPFETQPTISTPIAQLNGKVGSNISHIKGPTSCNTLTLSSNIVSTSCSVLPDKSGVAITYTVIDNPIPSQVEHLILDSDRYDILVANSLNPTLLDSIPAQKLSIELLGDTSQFDLGVLYQLRDEDYKHYGALTDVRDMFSTKKAGGVIGINNINDPSFDQTLSFEDACLAAAGEKEISIYEEEKLTYKTYKVKVDDTPSASVASTNFICDSSDVNPASCAGTELEKRMIIYDYQISPAYPSYIIKFNCSQKLGHLEETSVKTRFNKLTEMKQIINWNTEDSSYQRFERLKVENEKNLLVDGTWTHVREIRRMDRLMKIDASHYEAWHYGFDSQKQSNSLYKQTVEWKRMITSNLWLYTAADRIIGPIDYSSSIGIFTDPDSSVVSFLSAGPAVVAPTLKFEPNSDFPPIVITNPGGAPFQALPAGFDLFNGTVGFRPGALGNGESNIMGSFGTTFLTAP